MSQISSNQSLTTVSGGFLDILKLFREPNHGFINQFQRFGLSTKPLQFKRAIYASIQCENLKFIEKFVTYKVIPETVNANTSSSDTTDDAEDENAPLSDLISKKAIFAVLCEDTVRFLPSKSKL